MTTLTLQTPQDCVTQIIEGYNTVQRGYGIADEAICAYLQMDGCSVATLHQDLRDAGCEITRKTLYNRQSLLRGKGLLPPADERFKRDGNGGHSRGGNQGPSPEVTAYLYQLGQQMESAAERMTKCVKPHEFATATDEQVEELIDSVLQQMEALTASIDFYKENASWLGKTDTVFERIEGMVELRTMLKMTFGPMFEELDELSLT
jgi:hypothetical protein